MIDVFIATISEDPIRRALYQAVRHRWAAEKLANIRIFCPWPDLLDDDNFIEKEKMQRDRRIRADQLSTSPIYIVTDDDCMPIGPNFIERGLAVMEAHPDFAVLAALNLHHKDDYEPYTGTFIDDDVWHAHAVGGIRFCRKGAVKEWPESVSPSSYDSQHEEGIRAAGMKSGYMRRVLMNHLGTGLSTHWPEVPEIELYTGGRR